ncbi:Cullin-4A [Coemansia sp. RSA 2711]|nr:Cullin-4A [Coemansia sp. RSA 2711]KAJ1849686.1 Cullin-4A [Coemansia sp. RSA 2708]
MWASKRPGPPAGGPQKKLVIKGLKALPTLPASYKTDTLERLRAAVQAIQQSQPTTQGLEELYRDCEGMCLHGFASDVYAMLQAELEKYARQQLSQIDGQTNAQPAEGAMLVKTRQFWEGYTQQLAMIRCVFLYLDRTYALQTANVVSLWAMGLSVVRQHLASTNMRSRLVRLFIVEVTSERDGRLVDRPSLVSITRMFADLDLYSQSLLPSFIDATRDYYRRESLRMVNGLAPIQQPAVAPVEGKSSAPMDVPGYLAHVQQRLDEETQRVAQYLKPSTKSALLATTLTELVEKHADRLLSLSFDAMVDANMTADLARLYSLLLPVNKLDLLQQSWIAFIKKSGQQRMQAPDMEATLVSGLLEFKRKLDGILSSAFQSNVRLLGALREAFEAFINTRRSKPAQLIARHIDQCMRMGNKLGTDRDVDDTFDRIIMLFRFIQGKDLFEAYYRRDLAKRLLSSKMMSLDTERLMLQKLKTECGAGYTNRLEGMLRDMEASEELSSELVRGQSEPAANAIGFHANVLTMAFWPAYEPTNLVLPRPVEQAQECFTKLYGEKHRGRNLQWQHNLGTCIIKIEFEEGPKELQLSQMQATVMLLFAEQDELAYTQIQQSTGIEDAELQRTMQSLACGKFRVLTKEPKGRDVDASDKFCFNARFKCPQARIKISQLATKEIEKESKELEEHIHLDRMYRVDAALVRIMKARRTLEHGDVVTELLAQLNFRVLASEAKERIETLLERDYIRRDDSNPSIYHYVA